MLASFLAPEMAGSQELAAAAVCVVCSATGVGGEPGVSQGDFTLTAQALDDRWLVVKLWVRQGFAPAHLVVCVGYFGLPPALRRIAIRISSSLVSLGVCLVVMVNSGWSSKST